MRVWDLENLRPERVFNVEAVVLAVAFTQDSRIVVASIKGLMSLDWHSR